MTKSEIFKAAHAMARKVVAIVGDYMVAFSYSLKEVYKNMNAKNLTMAELAEKALELGATKWEKGTMSRIYINSDKMFGDVFGLEQVSERSPYAGKFQSIGKARFGLMRTKTHFTLTLAWFAHC